MAEMIENSITRPAVSVVIEGYNEARGLGTAAETMHELEAQDFPAANVEVILVGSTEQARSWNALYGRDTAFHSVKIVPRNGAHYYELKNGGAKLATGDIIAFTDSDVRLSPTWLSAIVKGVQDGADVTAGPTLFRESRGLPADSFVMHLAAAITWGWILGKRSRGPIPTARGFMDHNVAMRANVFGAHQYSTEFGRIIASPLLYRSLVDAGAKVAIQPTQQTMHHFTWRYWLISLHFRYGNEVYRLRRLDQRYPNRWILRTGILEPVVTMAWHMMLDVPKWFRLTDLLDKTLTYQVALLPLLVTMSAVARTAEMVGMYATILAPAKMRQWAENV